MDGMEKNLMVVLSDFRRDNSGVAGIVLSTADGLPIACDPRDRMDFLCAAAAAIHRSGINLGNHLGMKDFRFATVETDAGIFLVSGFDGVAVLVSLENITDIERTSRAIPQLMVKIRSSLGAE
jgi:predicted regulator of Ras-like GTPase activity (Roadblock/LC7/MglB family)